LFRVEFKSVGISIYFSILGRDRVLLGPSINNDQLSAFKSLYTYVRKSVTEVFESCFVRQDVY